MTRAIQPIVPHATAGVPRWHSPTLRSIASDTGPNASQGPSRRSEISASQGDPELKLCFIEIGVAGSTFTSDQITAMQAQVAAATARTGGAPFWNGGKSEVRTFLYGSYVDDVVAMQRKTDGGTALYYVSSGSLYSPQVLTDSTGAVVERYRYDAYGQRAVTTPSGTVLGRGALRFTRGFTGYDFDEATGLYCARGRMYDPRLGRFTGRDKWRNSLTWRQLAQRTHILAVETAAPAPMDGYQNGMSLYQAGFIPNFVDPSGLLTSSPYGDKYDTQKEAIRQTIMGLPDSCFCNVDKDESKNQMIRAAYAALRGCQKNRGDIEGWNDSFGSNKCGMAGYNASMGFQDYLRGALAAEMAAGAKNLSEAYKRLKVGGDVWATRFDDKLKDKYSRRWAEHVYFAIYPSGKSTDKKCSVRVDCNVQGSGTGDNDDFIPNGMPLSEYTKIYGDAENSVLP